VPDRLTLNEAQFLILLVLLDGPVHGYGIVKEIEDRTEGRVRLEPGNLYRYVRRLMQLGLVEDAEPSPASSRSSRRRPFRLTSDGRAALIADAERMSDLVRGLQQGLANS
jgi:DNA-binding PadR family transcriptional regulator